MVEGLRLGKVGREERQKNYNVTWLMINPGYRRKIRKGLTAGQRLKNKKRAEFYSALVRSTAKNFSLAFYIKNSRSRNLFVIWHRGATDGHGRQLGGK